MTSIAQISENEQREIKGTLKSFFTEYHLSGLLKMCRAEKQKGHSAFQIFKYLLCQVFCDRSMYMQIVTGRYEEEFSKNADRFGLTDDQLADFVRDFYDRLPVSYQRVLRLAA